MYFHFECHNYKIDLKNILNKNVHSYKKECVFTFISKKIACSLFIFHRVAFKLIHAIQGVTQSEFIEHLENHAEILTLQYTGCFRSLYQYFNPSFMGKKKLEISYQKLS